MIGLATATLAVGERLSACDPTRHIGVMNWQPERSAGPERSVDYVSAVAALGGKMSKEVLRIPTTNVYMGGISRIAKSRSIR